MAATSFVLFAVALFVRLSSADVIVVSHSVIHSGRFYSAVVHNVRPAGHIRPAMSCHVARNVQQENGYFRYGTNTLNPQYDAQH